jgi:hypothetical protein
MSKSTSWYMSCMAWPARKSELWKDGKDLAGFPATIGRTVAIAQADDQATLSSAVS